MRALDTTEVFNFSSVRSFFIGGDWRYKKNMDDIKAFLDVVARL